MSNDDIKQELRREFNYGELEAIGSAVVDAYRHLYWLSHQEDFLKGLTGADAKPHIRKAIVDLFLKQLPMRDSNIIITEEPNDGKNCWHIELRKGRFVVTHNFVHYRYEHPRDCEFRKNLQVNNRQLSFYIDDRNVLRVVKETEYILDDLIYAQIIHGGDGQHPSFIDLCLPNHDGSDWFDILAIPIVSRETPIEDIPDPGTPPLKEHKKKSENPDKK